MMNTHGENEDESQIHVLEIAGNAIVGGMEKYVYNLVQHLPAAHFKVTVLTPFESAFTSSLRQMGSEVYVTLMDINPPWRSIQFTTELVRHLKIDIIHTHLPRAHALGGIVGKLTGIPVVATIHGMEININDLSFCRTCGTNLTVVCYEAYSEALALGLPAEALTMIPNGVDTKTFTANRNGASFRKALHLAPATPLVGFVGRLAWEKGPDQFVLMAQHVHERLPDVHFVIVGEGPMEEELNDMMKAAKMESYFHMAGLWTNTWEVYPAMDIVVQTSRVEGMPFALLEAMACGRPVVAIGVGGVTEIVEVGTTGLLSAGSDWAGLGKAVVSLLNNPERMKQMGHASRKRVEESFDLRNSIRMMASLFYRKLGKKVPQELISQPHTPWQIVRPENQAVTISSNDIFNKEK